MSYAETFKKLQPDHDPRHIEAYVRLEHGTLGGLSMDTLRSEARTAAACIDLAGTTSAEELAQSFGL